MKKNRMFLVFFCLMILFQIISVECLWSKNILKKPKKSRDLILNITLTFDKKVYDYTDYGEPPQVAIWLEQPEKGLIKTIYVTYRTATGDWQGKIECPVSLPYWVSRYNLESHTKGLPGYKNPVPDGISAATPKDMVSVKRKIPADSEWKYFLEVNLAGDYNREFPANFDNGSPDPQGNGQPSIVFSGSIKIVKGAISLPQIIGRTDQLDRIKTLIKDLNGITSAKKIFSDIRIYITGK